jgi:hypothetical protein
MGAVYGNCDVVNPVKDPQVDKIRKSNTGCRIVTAIFTNEILPAFSKINDRKDRRDFETGNGSKNERLFIKISEMVNDTEATQLDELILPDNLGDEHIIAAVDDDGVNPKDFVQQSWQSVAKAISKFTKARKQVQTNMTISGTHDADTWNFIEPSLKSCKVSLNPIELYYFVMRCKSHPEVDAVFNIFLEEGVRYESTDDPTEGESGSSSTGKNKIQKELLQQLKETTKIAAAMVESSKDASKHRVKSNSRDDERNRRSNFNFYFDLCKKKDDLLLLPHSDPKNKMVRHINKEIAKLKKKLDLEKDSSDEEEV